MIIGEANFKILDRWERGIRMTEAMQPAVGQALTTAVVISIIRELLEGMV